MTLSHLALKVCFNSKFKLIYEDLFKRVYIILLVKNQHRFFIVNGIYRTK